MTNSEENAFARAAASVVDAAREDALRSVFRTVTPPASGWGLEFDMTAADSADFGCAVSRSTSIAEWPVVLRSARAFAALSELVSPAANGSWFFEFDADDAGRFGSDPHCFVRLGPDGRMPAKLSERLRSSSSWAAESTSLANVLERAPSGLQSSDAGVVVRGDRRQLRIGLAAHRSRASVLLDFAPVEPELRRSAEALLERVSSDAHCTVQLATGGGVKVTGVEISQLEAQAHEWRRLLDALVAHDLASRTIADAVLRWPGRERLPATSGAWPSVFARAFSHVKLVLKDGSVRAKLYLGAWEEFSLFV